MDTLMTHRHTWLLVVRMHRRRHYGCRIVLKMWVISVAPGDSNWTRTKLKSCGSDHQCHCMDLQGRKKCRLWKRQCSACRLGAKPWCTSRQSTRYERSCHKDDTSMFLSVNEYDYIKWTKQNMAQLQLVRHQKHLVGFKTHKSCLLPIWLVEIDITEIFGWSNRHHRCCTLRHHNYVHSVYISNTSW